VLTKRDKAALSRWATQPSKDGPIDQVRLWESLNAYVTKHGGRIISPLHSYPLRLETPPGSELPQKLGELGYDLIYKAEETRIGGPVWQYKVAVYELSLPRPNTPDYADKTKIAVQ
jgi:hypothetical protein